MSDHQEKLSKELDINEIPREQDPNFLDAKRKFEAEIKPGIDAYFPKLAVFTEAMLDTIKRSGKTAVFIGRDGRWLFYIAKLLADEKNAGLKDKIKFIDVGRDYVFPDGNYSHNPSSPSRMRKDGYEAYFKKLSIDINGSFLVDVGFQGNITHDIRDATSTKDSDDVLLVKSELELNPEIKGFYKGKSLPEWDEYIKMGHFIEELPQTISAVDELSPVRGGRLPKYRNTLDDRETFLSQMTYQYLKKSAGAFLKNQMNKKAGA